MDNFGLTTVQDYTILKLVTPVFVNIRGLTTVQDYTILKPTF